MPFNKGTGKIAGPCWKKWAIDEIGCHTVRRKIPYSADISQLIDFIWILCNTKLEIIAILSAFEKTKPMFTRKS